ncbi:hypothetical protein Curi_c18450 [Gottschalkia acidurici 9a]|uniref:Uncharacterized protein n=1 Tax=Gottschalkia acidurici (strain ATCC 7906 / DSM 604 / BCRC 14475 / CIP 104303 / KCTC 5404 / NCIMB 10678 / 9a) TaxID=1128398 RepID=K0B2M1_GOTA9|nr:hypothetical protein [Gottschalkia acidurici]AFS78851.1 hypothetical protein Curi_c18450 [Gottschalkia acidurici 9a]
MRKSFIIIITLFILTTFLFAKTYSSTQPASVTINNIVFKEGLNENLVKKYFSTNEEAKKQAEKRIKEIVIKDLGYSDWTEYMDYIEISLYPIDIIGDKKKELIIAVNLSKNLGTIAIYKTNNGGYELANKIENLTSIKGVSVKRNDTSDKRFLMVEEVLDESIGAYFTDNFIRLFTEIDNEFKEVFRESLNYEAFYYEKWIDPSKEKPKWFKLNEKSVVDYTYNVDNHISLLVSKTIERSEAKDNADHTIPKKFKKVEEDFFEIKYIWSEKYSSFILGEGEILSSKEEVGILEDTSKTADYLLKLGDKYYKVINKNMEIKYIKENEIKIIEDYSDKN